MHLEITNGRSQWSTSQGAYGTRYLFHEIGEQIFFVALVEAEGKEILWDGKSYEAAIIEAELAAKDWGTEVADLVKV